MAIISLWYSEDEGSIPSCGSQFDFESPVGYNKTMRECIYCGELTSNVKFCSISCSAKEQAKSRKVTEMVKTCLRCEKEFLVTFKNKRNKYCSHSCAAKVTNAARGKDKFCRGCNSPLGRIAKFYCSQDCQMKWQREDKIARWIAGTWMPDSEYSVPPSIRNFLLTEANFECTLCKWSEINPTTGKVPLQIDHINGNARDNSRENLRVLCPNCHSLTPNFGALNRGNGRSYRYASLA